MVPPTPILDVEGTAGIGVRLWVDERTVGGMFFAATNRAGL